MLTENERERLVVALAAHRRDEGFTETDAMRMIRWAVSR